MLTGLRSSEPLGFCLAVLTCAYVTWLSGRANLCADEPLQCAATTKTRHLCGWSRHAAPRAQGREALGASD